MMEIAENNVARVVVDAAARIYFKLGSGLLESVYETLLEKELEKRGLRVERQVSIPLIFDGIRFPQSFRADLIVENLVIVEIKSTYTTHPAYKSQLRTYLNVSGKRLGLLINFGSHIFKNGITRVANGLPNNGRQ